MANLYEIDRAILECVDCETGEIIDPERLDNLLMERNTKIEAVALWVKNLESDAAAYKAEQAAFAKREEQALAKAESLKKWLARACDGQKFNTAKCAVNFRKSESVEILDESKIPAAFMRTSTKTTTSPDKAAIKKAIKSGQEIGGCKLVENLNAKIQ